MNDFSNKNPLVSIGIITYNQKSYLKKCIDSCLMQDYQNIEIIIADDCSTDGTQDMLEEYRLLYPEKIKVLVSEVNKGITANSNVVLASCSGEYIALTGGDDAFESDKISKQVKVFIDNAEVVICGTYTKIINENDQVMRKQKDIKNKVSGYYNQAELIESCNSIVPVVSYMIKANAIPEEGFDFRLPVASDSLFYFRVAEKGKIYIIKEYLTSYRIHDSHARRIGYKDDALLCMALTEYHYPNLLSSINVFRFLFYMVAAKREFNNKNYLLAQGYFNKSFYYSANYKLLFYVANRIITRFFKRS